MSKNSSEFIIIFRSFLTLRYPLTLFCFQHKYELYILFKKCCSTIHLARPTTHNFYAAAATCPLNIISIIVIAKLRSFFGCFQQFIRYYMDCTCARRRLRQAECGSSVKSTEFLGHVLCTTWWWWWWCRRESREKMRQLRTRNFYVVAAFELPAYMWVRNNPELDSE